MDFFFHWDKKKNTIFLVDHLYAFDLNHSCCLHQWGSDYRSCTQFVLSIGECSFWCPYLPEQKQAAFLKNCAWIRGAWTAYLEVHYSVRSYCRRAGVRLCYAPEERVCMESRVCPLHHEIPVPSASDHMACKRTAYLGTGQRGKAIRYSQTSSRPAKTQNNDKCTI